MTITMVNRRKGGKPEDMVGIWKKMNPIWLKYGAQNVHVDREFFGPDTGQWTHVVVCKDWETFGKMVQDVQNDSEFRACVGQLDAMSEQLSRRVLVNVEI